ncbi:MAG: DNA-processing protein DprA [bacterium]|nr:DNA-processing protein DprA [bacterium]
MDANEIIFLNALNSIPGVGVATLRMLKSRMGSFRDAWHGNISALAAGSFSKPIHQIISARPSLDPEKEFQKLEQHGIWIMTDEDISFPALLREIPHPPLFLYGKGIKPDAVRTHVGIVGTRRPTPYGREVAASITTGLAHQGLVIVSGLAVGIDTVAHEAALAAKNPTVAVIGSGIDERSLFPQQNIGLSRRIVEQGGTIISEYAPGTPPMKEHFPLRNRIIAGLSRGIFVAEARERSGALITAQLALDQNRDVFAAPGSIFSPSSVGPNLLIQQGAKLILKTDDILSEWDMQISYTSHTDSDTNLDNNEKTVLKLLEQELTIDELSEQTKIQTPILMSLLSLLELKGYVRQMGNNSYQRV